jgi:hypothetical protein
MSMSTADHRGPPSAVLEGKLTRRFRKPVAEYLFDAKPALVEPLFDPIDRFAVVFEGAGRELCRGSLPWGSLADLHYLNDEPWQVSPQPTKQRAAKSAKRALFLPSPVFLSQTQITAASLRTRTFVANRQLRPN